jgi:hypothetical protein
MRFLLFLTFSLLFSFCKKEETPAVPSAQPRLNNIGQPASIPLGNAAQTPDFKELSLHYIELAPTAFTLLGKGAVVYKAEETTTGGEPAVDFDKALKSGPGTVFTKLSLKDLPPGTYEWVRASVTYQNYDIRFNINELPIIGSLSNQQGRVASFLGFNTYLRTIKPNAKSIDVNDDKKQGFWAFETAFEAPYDAYNQVYSGQAPAGATTVVNPLFATSPVPAGSCVITGKFEKPLVITGKEDKDITITLAFSTKQSLEWIDDNGNGQLDFYANPATPPEKIVDMGLRGLIPRFE